MSDDHPGDAGYDDWLDALEAGEPTYLECPEGHGSLPPRRVCPTCGATELTEKPLPETGELETVTVTRIPTPAFADDAPYAVGIARFGPVRLTGHVIGIDLEEIEPGLTVIPECGESVTTGDRLIQLRVS